MGDSMYVTEELKDIPEGPSVGRAFIYDVDYTDVRHYDPSRRRITCTNRRPLLVEGLHGDIKRILPCMTSNSIYLLVDRAHGLLNASVHRVTTEGASLSTWDLNLPVQDVNHWALISFFGNPGRYLLVSDSHYRYMYFYNSTTGILLLSDDGIVSEKNTTRGICAIDDRKSLLALKDWDFEVLKINDSNNTLISIKSGIVSWFKPRHHWYNEERGLIFSPRNASLMVLRITY